MRAVAVALLGTAMLAAVALAVAAAVLPPHLKLLSLNFRRTQPRGSSLLEEGHD